MPAADKVLIQIETMANMAGVEKAQAGMLGIGVTSLAAAAGLGILFVAGKNIIEITEKQEKADRSLEQAVKAYNDSIGQTAPLDQHAAEARAKAADVAGKAQDSLTISTNAAKIAQLAYTDAVHKHGVKSQQAQIAAMHLQDANIRLAQATDTAKDAQLALTAATVEANVHVEKVAVNLNFLKGHITDFIKENRRYIESQAEVTEGFAKLTRAGLNQDEVQKDMNRALDLSVISGKSLSESVDLLIKAEQGRMKGLIELGISTGKYTDAQGNLVNGTKDAARAFAEMDVKLKDGRKSSAELHQAQLEIGNTWQDLANTQGPALLAQLTLLTQYVANNMPTWATWLGQLNDIGNQLAALGHLGDIASRKTHDSIIKWYRENSGDRGETLFPTHAPTTTTTPGFAEGGIVPGPIGRPMFAVVHGGETVTPAGGGTVRDVHVHIDGIYAGDGPSLDILANKIALRLGYATGR